MMHPIGRQYTAVLCVFLMTTSTLMISGCPETPVGGSVEPLVPGDTFKGITVYTNAPDGLVLTVDVTETQSIHMFGRLTDEGLPTDLYRMFITNDGAPQDDLGFAFDGEGRVIALARGAELFSTYSYSLDGTQVTEVMADGTTNTFTIDPTLTPQDVLDSLGAATGNDFSNFFSRVSVEDFDVNPAKSRAHEKVTATNVFNVALSAVSLGIAAAGVVALAPEAGALLIFASVGAVALNVMNTALQIAVLVDPTDNAANNPTVTQLSVAGQAVSFVTTLGTSSIAVATGVGTFGELEAASLAVDKVGLLSTALQQIPIPPNRTGIQPPQPEPDPTDTNEPDTAPGVENCSQDTSCNLLCSFSPDPDCRLCGEGNTCISNCASPDPDCACTSCCPFDDRCDIDNSICFVDSDCDRCGLDQSCIEGCSPPDPDCACTSCCPSDDRCDVGNGSCFTDDDCGRCGLDQSCIEGCSPPDPDCACTFCCPSDNQCDAGSGICFVDPDCDRCGSDTSCIEGCSPPDPDCAGAPGDSGTGVCGDGVCDTGAGEADTCPGDCPAVCGDGICNASAGEEQTCPQDCPEVQCCVDTNGCPSEELFSCPGDCCCCAAGARCVRPAGLWVCGI